MGGASTTKSKGPSGRRREMLFRAQHFCANIKLVCSTGYHKQHHFSTEMSNPAILAPVNEFLTSMALHRLGRCKLGSEQLRKIEYILVKGTLVVSWVILCE